MGVHDISKEILEDKAMTLDDVDLLMTVLQTKRKRIVNATPLRIGDRVRFRHIKPKYLEGCEGTIIGQANTKIKVRMDDRVGRYGGEVRVPRTALEKIERVSNGSSDEGSKEA